MEFHCPGLSGSAESAGRRPEHEAPAAAGGATPVPVRSAPHRWAPGGPGAEAGWGEQRGSTCGAVGCSEIFHMQQFVNTDSRKQSLEKFLGNLG